MAGRRWKGTFTPLGGLRAERLGLPKKLAREMALRRAWVEVAGAAIAGRATARGIRRGVLEIEVDDPAWARTLRELLPTLAGRLATRCPELRIRKCRLQVTGAAEAAAASRTVQARPRTAPAPPPPSASGARRERETDLEKLMERYLARGGEG